MKKISLLVICAMQTFAADPIEVISLDSSAGCGAMNHEVNLDPNDSSTQCLRVYFKEFSLASGSVSELQRNCHMQAKLLIPAGMQFRATEAVAEGVYKMDEASYGGLTLSYMLDATGAMGHWFEDFRPQTQGDFNFSAKIASEALTPCSHHDLIVTLNSDLHMFIDQTTQGNSLVSLDETGKRLSWNWHLTRCEPDYYALPFVSYYKAPNGRTYQAILTLNGTKGTYESEAGFTGQLFGIKRSEGGLVAEGHWQASGVKGTFKFRITNSQAGEFKGDWRDNQGRMGTWWGSYQE